MTEQVKYEMTVDGIIKFLEDVQPSIRRLQDGRFEIFTAPTQHIKGATLRELIEYTMCYVNEYGNKGFIEQIESVGNIPKPPKDDISKEDISELVQAFSTVYRKAMKGYY